MSGSDYTLEEEDSIVTTFDYFHFMEKSERTVISEDSQREIRG